MKTLIRTRTALLGILIGALTGLALPGAAHAGHDLSFYKAEAQVDLESDEKTVDLACNPGDPVLDGMWRIDHADQDDDDMWLTAIARSVDVVRAIPIDGSTYRFTFVKQAIGRVQAKVFVTCLKAKSSMNAGHKHAFVLTDYFNQTDVSAWNNTEFTPDWDWIPDNGDPACPAGYWAVSPGFEFTSPAYDVLEPGSFRMYRSQYSDYKMRNWTWAFQFPASGGKVSLRLRCLRIAIDTIAYGTGTERHKFVGKYMQYSPTFKKKRVYEGQSTCGSHYKAVVSGFAIDPTLVGAGLNDWPATKLWYLGMDPRIKTRALKVLNSGGTNQLVDMRTLCVNYRTT